MKKYKELEIRLNELERTVRDICSSGKGLPNSLLECVGATRFLLEYKNDEIGVRTSFDNDSIFHKDNYYILDYVFKGELKTVFLTDIFVRLYTNLRIVSNNKNDIIISATTQITKETIYFKVDKRTQNYVNITEEYTNNRNLKENILSLSLDKMELIDKITKKEPKTSAKNVKKTTEKTEKKVEKKTKKAKESK